MLRGGKITGPQSMELLKNNSPPLNFFLKIYKGSHHTGHWISSSNSPNKLYFYSFQNISPVIQVNLLLPSECFSLFEISLYNRQGMIVLPCNTIKIDQE